MANPYPLTSELLTDEQHAEFLDWLESAVGAVVLSPVAHLSPGTLPASSFRTKALGCAVKANARLGGGLYPTAMMFPERAAEGGIYTTRILVMATAALGSQFEDLPEIGRQLTDAHRRALADVNDLFSQVGMDKEFTWPEPETGDFTSVG